MKTHTYDQEFLAIFQAIHKVESVLLFAHRNPDPDTVGSVLALEEYLISLGKRVEIACFNAFPDSLKSLFRAHFIHPDHIQPKQYNLVIAADSVDMGFNLIRDHFTHDQTIILLDHHHDIQLRGDINIIDPSYSSTCEIIYNFFQYNNIEISKEIATALLTGILGDTGGFQHANTSSRVLEAGADLIKCGAPVQKITNVIFANRNLPTLKLWGKAFDQVIFYKEKGFIISIITQQDIVNADVTPEETLLISKQIAGALATVPGVKFSLVLFQKTVSTIKASLRSEESGKVDVSTIAHLFGGGGHPLASGFEIKGKLIQSPEGWIVQ